MDKAVFVANLAQVKKRKILLIRVALSFLFVLLAGSMWMDRAHPHDRAWSAIKTVGTVGFASVVFLCITSVQRMARRLGLHCPHCGRSLSGPLSHRVVAGGTCYHCGNQVF
jgi:DMSO/TMAO reductase YedYZ heme-binding membrane subunit